MRWIRNEVIESNVKICVIFDRHRGIKRVFQWPHLGWSVERGLYTDIACKTLHKNYIRKLKNLQRKKIISVMILE
jgi:hypothetical protein